MLKSCPLLQDDSFSTLGDSNIFYGSLGMLDGSLFNILTRQNLKLLLLFWALQYFVFKRFLVCEIQKLGCNFMSSSAQKKLILGGVGGSAHYVNGEVGSFLIKRQRKP